MNGPKNEKPFVFRQFEVDHHLCAHKVGFDGVLLGAWAHFDSSQNILDVGTGCGLIALMAAQQNPGANITAIETDENSVQQARLNFARSKWNDRLRLVHDDFLLHRFDTIFDHVVTNPPFYVDRIRAKGMARSGARHFTPAQLGAFVRQTALCLSTAGKFSIIIPWHEWPEFKTVLLDAGYWVGRECTVFTRDPQQPERVLLECQLRKCEKEVTQLNIYGRDGKYSQEYVKLTGPFYLNI